MPWRASACKLARYRRFRFLEPMLVEPFGEFLVAHVGPLQFGLDELVTLITVIT
jgi:hypothetical protein